MQLFHRKCGERVSLINNGNTAVRNVSEYNCGLIFSAEPLRDDEIFQVRIDKKMMIWSGSIEIGVTACNPDNTNLPASATSLRHGSWIMTGSSIVHDGVPILELYGTDLNTLNEGSTLGICRTTKGELVFYINGVPQGIAAVGVPPRVFAVINLYGNCIQVSAVQSAVSTLNNNTAVGNHSVELNNDQLIGDDRASSSVANLVTNLNVNLSISPKTAGSPAIREDRLRFHERVGFLVKLSNNSRTAERRRPLDEFNNGVVMTHRPLRDNELFEIRIDRLVDKWSGSIEVGVTTHSPTALEFPATMTNMRSGTTMMSGCGILTNGKGTQREYGEFNLDELREGDRVGMMRKSNGNLHYFINGLDQGIAAKVPNSIWGVIDLYGMTVKVTIVDRDEREEQNLVTRRNTLQLQGINDAIELDEPIDRLMFHPCCGTHADVINNGRTAHRPNAVDDFNNGVVLTSRPLKPNELFEVRLDKIVSKWAGSIEIGVTTHSPTELEFPFTMTNVRSGTWMMTGNGVMHNGSTMIDQYGQNLDRLQVGDRVGVMRKENSTLHFYVNGLDQGTAATSVPERIYGVIDLYGQAAQATIVDFSDICSPTTINSSTSNTTLYCDLRFHHVHGKNARIMNNGLTASRPRALGEFNDAIVVSNRALRDGEMFEVSIDKMVDRWSGSIEAGVTAIRPDELEFPSTMTDIDHDTWMLSGSTVMGDGVGLRNNYPLDLDKLVEGNRIGMMRCSDSSLHYYLDGVDQGPACTGLPAHVYPVIDLYGQCAQVTIVAADRREINLGQPSCYPNSETSTMSGCLVAQQKQPVAVGLEPSHRFHESVGLNVQLDGTRTVATRCREYSNAVLLSNEPLESNELFEVTVQEIAREWSGSLRVGLLANERAMWLASMNLVQGLTAIPADAWHLTGNQVRHKGQCLCWNYCPNLDWLRVGDKIGLVRTSEGNLKFYVNGEDMGVAASNVPDVCFAVLELFGSTAAVRISSTKQSQQPHQMLHQNQQQVRQVNGGALVCSPTAASIGLQDSLELLLVDAGQPGVRSDVGADPLTEPYPEGKLINDLGTTPTQTNPTGLTDVDWSYEFHENHGRNVQLEKNTIASRVASYNQGVVMSSKPLKKNRLFQVRIDKVNERWVSGMSCGVSCLLPEKVVFPVTALGMKRYSWIICSDWMSHNGKKIRSSYGAKLDGLRVGSTVGLLLDSENQLHLYIDGSDQGVAVSDLPPYVYAVFDIYGQSEQISIVEPRSPTLEVDVSTNLVNASRIATEAEDVENSREKADLEYHEKENGASTTLDESSQYEDDESRLERMNEILMTSSLDNDLANRNQFPSDPKCTMALDPSSNDVPTDQQCLEVSNSNSENLVVDNVLAENGESLTPPPTTRSTNEGCSSVEATSAHNEDICTNAELNNATNINIKNGTAINTANMSNLNSAINANNANNAINESIASNSSQNNINATSASSNLKIWQLNPSAGRPSHGLALSTHWNSANAASAHPTSAQPSVLSTPLANGGVGFLAAQPQSTGSGRCEYLEACQRLKRSLVLPDEFFSGDEALCYCGSCFKLDADSGLCKKGEPLAAFAVPAGWVRFPLRHSINANQVPQSTTDKWHVAFYGARIDTVRRILDRGELLTREQLDNEFLTTHILNENQSPQVVFSPNVKCVSSKELPKKYSYIDAWTKKQLAVSVAFQVLVKPGSYTTLSKKSSLDSTSDCIEWATKETGATVIMALLVHLDGL